MKKTLRNGFLLAGICSIFLISACSNGTDNTSNSEPYDQAGKEHFLVLTNDTVADVSLENLIKNNASMRAAGSINSNPGIEELFESNAIKENSDYENIINVNIDDPQLIEILRNSDRNADPRFKTNANILPQKPLFTASEVGNTRNFWCYNTNMSSNNELVFTLKAIGQKCQIWFCNATDSHEEPDITNEQFNSLAASLDQVFEHEMAIFGSNIIEAYSNQLINAPQGTKLNVLIYDICGDKNPPQGQAVVGGLFASKDLFLQASLGNDIKSNECECIHADSYLLKKDIDKNSKFITSTLLHEFQHLLNFVNKTVKISNNPVYATWYTEMLSMCAEDVFQTQLGLQDNDSPKSRLATFAAAYHDGFRNWRDSTGNSNDVLKSYANAYAFGAFLMRNYGGVNLINQIATNDAVDEASISAALAALGHKEDFYSVLHKFGNAIVFPTEADKLNLNKNVIQDFSGVRYNLTAINLMNYGNLVLEANLPAYYDYKNRIKKVTVGEQEMTAIYGPIILNKGYYPIANLGSAGTFVTYYGAVDSKPEITLPEGITGITQTIIIKE